MLQNISITNYRNITRLMSDLDKKNNILIALNSSGKTNLLESIYYSIFGSSFKLMQSNSELIGPSGDFAKILLNWDDGTTEFVVSKTQNSILRKFTLDQKKYPVRKLVTKFPIVVFAPNSVDIISGEPSLRRSDLDNYLSMIDENYKLHIDRYLKLLKNRNALIKLIREGKSKDQELAYWTNEMVKSANEVYIARSFFFNTIKDTVKDSVEEMKVFLQDDLYKKVSLKYQPNIESEIDNFSTVLLQKYSENLSKEIAAGKTLYGVHKDDYSLFIGSQNMRFFGSRGQQRLSIFLIKYAQMYYYYKKFNKWPLFLIDDLMSELDQKNRLKAANFLCNQEFQYILTSAEEFEIPRILIDSANQIVIS